MSACRSLPPSTESLSARHPSRTLSCASCHPSRDPHGRRQRCKSNPSHPLSTTHHESDGACRPPDLAIILPASSARRYATVLHRRDSRGDLFGAFPFVMCHICRVLDPSLSHRLFASFCSTIRDRVSLSPRRAGRKVPQILLRYEQVFLCVFCVENPNAHARMRNVYPCMSMFCSLRECDGGRKVCQSTVKCDI